MFKKIQEFVKKFIEEKGQGVVEYALILGFVAVIAVILLSKTSLQENVQANIDNQNSVLKAMDSRFDAVANSVSGTGDDATTTIGGNINP